MQTQLNGATASVSSGTVLPKFDYLDLKAQYSAIREEITEAIARVMESQHFILGAEVEQFENEVAAYIGAKHTISCASGSDALVLAMLAAGVGPGDEIITSPFTFIATGGAIARVGAIPVYVDIDAETFNISPSAVDAAITPRTRGIMPVHLFGLPAEMNELLALAKVHSLLVFEDAAQAIGSRYHGQSVGTLGTFGCFSFFPSKNLGGAGDGGLITTEDASLTERLRMLRVHGSRKKYHHEILGTNSRLDALQAAILRVKLRHLNEWTQQRRLRADRYRALFAGLDLVPDVLVPDEPRPEFFHVYNQFTIRCTRRDALREYLRNEGVPTEIYYPLPLHLQPAFSYLNYQSGQLPFSEAASQQVLSLPVYPELSESQQQRVVSAIAGFYAQHH